MEEAKLDVQQQEVVGADETGFNQGNIDGGNPKQQQAWLWVAVIPLVTFFEIALTIGFFSVIAVELLHLTYLHRHQPHANAIELLNPLQLQVLRVSIAGTRNFLADTYALSTYPSSSLSSTLTKSDK